MKADSPPFPEKRAMKILATIQVVSIVVFGLLTVNRFQVWAPIDEGAHFDYILFIAEHGRLPVLGQDMTSDAVARVHEARYPPLPGADAPPALGDYVYEAFQPPLYYLTALPAYLLPGEVESKIMAVRYFDLGLLLAAVAILFALCREAFEDPWVPFTFGLSLMMLPAVVVRSITVSNGALELPVALFLMLFLVRAWNRRGAGDLAVAGIALGLCLLTKLTLVYLLVPFGLTVAVKLLRERRLRSVLGSLGASGLPVLLVAPWLWFNQVHYGQWTANGLARHMQQPVVNPGRIDYGASHLEVLGRKLLNFPMPGEWFQLVREDPVTYVRNGLLVAFLAVPLLLLLVPRRGPGAYVVMVLSLPLLVNAGLLVGSTVIANHDTLHPRYLFASLIPWAASAGGRYRGVLRRPWLVAAVPWAATAALIAIWVDLVVGELLANPPFPPGLSR